MHWFAAHLYVTGLIVTGLLLLTGAVLVNSRAPISGVDAGGTWSGASISLFSGTNNKKVPTKTPRIRTEDLLKGQTQKSSYTTLPIGQSESQDSSPSGNFNWEALMAQLVQPHNGSTPATVDNTLGVYAFIPQGLISVREVTQERTETQEALFEYGNTVGSFILAFDDSHSNMLQTLKDAYQDRGNAQKVQAASQIGSDYIRLGEELGSIDTIPPEVGGLHQLLANAYKKSGQLLIAKLQAKDDRGFIAAINAYNASVDEFQKTYISLITLFEVAEVQFSNYDPGRIFMFQSTSI